MKIASFLLPFFLGASLQAQLLEKTELHSFKHKFSRVFIYGEYERVFFTLEKFHYPELDSTEYFVRVGVRVTNVEPHPDPDVVVPVVQSAYRDQYLLLDEFEKLIRFVQSGRAFKNEPFTAPVARSLPITDALSVEWSRPKRNRMRFGFQLYDLKFYDNETQTLEFYRKLGMLWREIERLPGREL